MKIAIDAMGGDYAPKEIIKGTNLAIKEFEDMEIILFGDESQINQYIEANDRYTIVHTDEVITGDDEPVRSIRRKKKASMVLAAEAVKNKEADVLISAGNTGALLACGLLKIGRIKHIDRPGLMPIIPTRSSKSPQFLLMDAGANADTKPINLHQFAILANFYAENVLEIKNPRVGLINNGEEASKGSELSKAAYELLVNEPSIHFIGNIESDKLLDGVADIVITDGFTGNAILKTSEGIAKVFMNEMEEALLHSGILTKLGALLVKDSIKKRFSKFDDTKTGGAVLLGVKAPVIKTHGSSKHTAIYNALKQAHKIVSTKAIDQAVSYFESLV